MPIIKLLYNMLTAFTRGAPQVGTRPPTLSSITNQKLELLMQLQNLEPGTDKFLWVQKMFDAKKVEYVQVEKYRKENGLLLL